MARTTKRKTQTWQNDLTRAYAIVQRVENEMRVCQGEAKGGAHQPLVESFGLVRGARKLLDKVTAQKPENPLRRLWVHTAQREELRDA